MSKQTRSFIFIIILGVAIALVAFVLNKRAMQEIAIMEQNTPLPQHLETKPEPPAEPVSVPPADTTGWKTYTSRNYPFTFKYPSTWTAVPTPTSDEYDTITITPSGTGASPMHVYLSKTGYLGMDNLQSQPITVSGQAGINVQDLLVGVKYENVYYTFDIGSAINNQAEFNAIVQSVVYAPKQ